MAEHIMHVSGRFYDDDAERAVNVYKDIFKDKKIGLFEEPRVARMPEETRPGKIEFAIDSNDLDDTHMGVIWPAESQLRALRDYENIPDAPAAPDPAQLRNTVVVNMFGGPGAGKSTAALEVAEKLKKAGYAVEYAPEYAKELVWDMNDPKATPGQRIAARAKLDGSYEHQMELYAEQMRRVERCIGQCDFVVTDSPPILGVAYLKEDYPQQREDFERMARADFGGMCNFNMVVERGGDYEQAGRYQTPDEAAAIDANVVGFLDRFGIYHGTYDHGQIDKAIENMQKTLRRIVGHEQAVAQLKSRVANKAESGKEKPEAHDEGLSARKGRVIDMAEEKKMEFVNIPFPKTGYQGRDLFRTFPGKDGNEWIQVKFPPHTPEMINADGEKFDPSNRTFVVKGGPAQAIQSSKGNLGVKTGSVVDWNNDPKYKTVSFPKESRDGEPWNIEAKLEKGHMDMDDGKWVTDEIVKDRVDVSQVAQAMDYYRAERADYVRERREERAKEAERAQEQAKEADAPFEQAPQADAPAQEAPAKEAPRPSKAAPAPKARQAPSPADDAKAAHRAAAARSTKKAAPTKAQSK